MTETTTRRHASAIPAGEKVLTTAVARVADLWQLTNGTLGKIIGVSGPTASRLRAGQRTLERGTKPFELAQYLVRLFRSLDSLTGSDDVSSISWLHAENRDLMGRPIDLIQTIKGLTEVASYVDDFRAPV
jgi:hypothetical protein